MQSPRKEIIQTIYLYIVTLVGLFMIVIPGVDIIKIGLEKWIFPLAVEDEYSYAMYPPEPYGIKERITAENAKPIGEITLTEDEVVMLENWKVEYKAWQEKDKNKDRVAIRMQISIVRDISILLGGLALFFSHGYVLRKKRKETELV